jgi:chromosome segregation ATPase
MAAIDKAVEILKKGQGSFLQVTKEDPELDPEAARRQQLVDMLGKLARSTQVFSLQQIATAAAEDPFTKVKTMIQSLIDRLLNEAAEEAEGKSFCEDEMTKTRAKQKELAAKIDRHAVRIEKSASKKAVLAQQVKELQSELATLDANQAEATKLRQEEHAAFLKSSEEYKTAATSIADAMQVLQQYYAGAGFVQTAQAPTFGGNKGDAASTIIGLLEVAESDFTRLLSEAEAEENAATKSYDSLTQENAVSKAAKTAEANAKGGEIKTLEVQLLNSKEDHSYVTKELDAVMDYLDKLKPQCETKVMSYSERKSRREQEIAGLKEALTLLE